MGNITKELEKLFCYALERDVITREDIDAVCVTQISNHIFDMVNAVAEKQQKKALDMYYELLALKEPPMRILFLLGKGRAASFCGRKVYGAGKAISSEGAACNTGR